jgi:2-methylisocitrate lyase-like PEP mutase family enzyme
MVSANQKEKAKLFLKYHHEKEILVLLNSWDIGSSKLIEASGYKAIATTSMGIAASLGYPDCQVIQLSEMIATISGIVNGVQVPVHPVEKNKDIVVLNIFILMKTAPFRK